MGRGLVRRVTRLSISLTAITLLLLAQPLWLPGQSVEAISKVYAEDQGRFYSQTGKTLAPQFVDYYDRHGGIPLFGYPISDAHLDGGYLVQWTERQRLEWHPENAGTDFEVLIGLLGRELTKGLDGPRFKGQQPQFTGQSLSASGPSSPDPAFFPQTGHAISSLFLAYWQQNGGLAVFGYPISELYSGDSGVQVQWFERARFEYHPELSGDNKVLLGLVGVEALKQADVPLYKVQVNDVTAPENGLQVGLSQGGESDDPTFFDNIRQPVSDLGPGLVRLDNIYDFYGIVHRDASGAIAYDWSRFDQVVDSIYAMGKEPFICLSYMPETMASLANSRISPPANYDEWAALVAATVRHLNVERRLGVEYWEVWNEPNEDSFWNSSFFEYLRLYDTTVQAALSVDPSILIGGPAVSRFSPSHLHDFLLHESQLAPGKARIDFISWHEYGQSPDDLAEHIRETRQVLAEFPQFNPKLFVTEFNVLQGGPGDTSANSFTDKVDGAIAFMASVESMQRERLDRAFLFELKDGPGPKQFWGRWGILTNDGTAKPIYQALKAYQTRPSGALPVTVKSGPIDGSIGMMAFGSPSKSTLILWYTGTDRARIKLEMPTSFSNSTYDITLFDDTHNNPARTGDATLKHLGPPTSAGDLLLDLKPNSLVILTSR